MANSRKNKNLHITDEENKKCNAIIHSASVAAGGVGTGLAQIPLSDNAVITPIQIGMVIALGKVFDRNITKSAARAIISGMTASFVGRGISQVLIGWVPGVGNAVNTATAAGITEAIGWMAVQRFSDQNYNESIGIEEKECCDGSGTDAITTDSNEAEEEQDSRETLFKEMHAFLSGERQVDTDEQEYYNLLSKLRKLDLDETDPEYENYMKFINLGS